MAIDTQAVSSVYTSLFTSVTNNFNALWDSNRIDAETYTKLLSSAAEQLLELSVNAVQKQQQLDAELAKSAYELSVLLPDQHNENLSKKAILDQQKLTEVQNTVKAAYENSTLLPDQHNTNVKQLEALNKDIDIKERSTVIQEKQSVQDILNKQSQKTVLDQQKLTEVQNTAKAAYEVSTLLPDQHNESVSKKSILDQQKLTEVQQTARATYENSTLLVDQHNTNLKQLEALNKDINVKERSTVVQEAQSAQDLLNKQSQKAVIDQQKLTEIQQTAKAAYEVSTLLVDQHNTNLKQQTQLTAQIDLVGKQESQLDEQILVAKQEVKKATYEVATLLPDQHNQNVKQLEAIDKDIEVKTQTLKNAYVEQVIKDKEAAKLGLDNVVKNAETTRLTNSNAVYTPKYGV